MAIILGVTLFVIIIFGILLLWNPAVEESGLAAECVDVNGATSYVFDACYDIGSKTIFLNVRRSIYDNYDLRSIDVSYFDVEEREYGLIDIPSKGEARVYHLDSIKNPRNAYITLDINKDFSEPVCSVPRRLFVKSCEGGIPTGASTGTTGYETPKEVDLRTHLVELEQKEEAWKTKCESAWSCSEWESCHGGIQKRVCEDTNSCFIPTGVPSTAQYCSDACLEDWKCTWSDCINSKTTPNCYDSNSCGTEFNKPKALTCDFEGTCEPEVECTDWSSCTIDYDLIDLSEGNLEDLPGTQTRVCIDKNSCIGSLRESKHCSTGVDIYTSRYTKCGVEYVDLYDKLNGDLVARLDVGTPTNPRLNIRLDGGKGEIYCDHCYNGILDGDEKNIDCGGSCEKCETKDQITLSEKSFFDKILDIFR